jgi:hypothetical protein
MAGGEDDNAYSMLAEVIETSDAADSEKAQRHLELAVTKTNTSAESAQAKVAALQRYIEENKGDGEGDDGQAFGHEIASIARSEGEGPGTAEPPSKDSASDGIEPASQAGSSANAPGQQKDNDTPADPADTEDQPDQSPGNSADAPGQQKGNDTPADPADTEDQPDQSRGDSADAPGQQRDKGNGK